jgi:hypothetical protein
LNSVTESSIEHLVFIAHERDFENQASSLSLLTLLIEHIF